MVTRAVLLDLDGTLVDTAADLAAAVNATLAALDCAPLDLGEVRSFIGEGVAVLVRRSLAARMDGNALERELPGALRHFERCYHEANGRFSAPYPGVVDALAALRGRGLKTGCVTNKPVRFAEPLLARFGLAATLDVVIGGDSTPAKKPHPAPVLEACRRLGVAPPECVLVGDSTQDAHAAHAAGVRFVAVSYGYGSVPGARTIGTLMEAACDEREWTKER